MTENYFKKTNPLNRITTKSTTNRVASDETMNQPNQNKKLPGPAKRGFSSNPHSPPHMKFVTEPKVKEIVTEMLIELDLIPVAKKTKGITIE